MVKLSSKNVDGTSFHGVTINTSVKRLKDVLGEPQNSCGDKKCSFVWDCETKDGSVFTIYDWKFYRELDENEIVEFNIGGFSKSVTLKAKEEILEVLK